MAADFGEKHHRKFHKLLDYLSRIPAVQTNGTPWRGFRTGEGDHGCWWVKLQIDINHRLSWHAVQELGSVLNGPSLTQRLTSVFKLVSPPPYMNGGPGDFLSWIIEVSDRDMRPGMIVNYLEGRLPRPVDDLYQWDLED